MNTESIARREFLRAGAALGALSLTGLPAWASGAASDRPPNIVLIMADDLGYECVGADGGTSYQTPQLDQLAAGGVRFDHCHAQPLCTPSRVQLLTGIYNVRNYIRFGVLDWHATTFAQLLRDAGYATCISGKWQLGGGLAGPEHFGFDEYCLWQLDRRPERYKNPGLEINGRHVDYTSGEYGPDLVCDYACDFMRRKRDEPFLVYYPMMLTHSPFVPTPDSPDWERDPQDWQRDMSEYFADMVAYMDKLVGKLTRQLEKLGLRENTLILFTGDNGTGGAMVSQMGDHRVVGGKGKTKLTGTHVPLIASWPGTISTGQVSADLVDFSDMLPTVCEAAGVDVPTELAIDGQSFLPQLRGEQGTPREWTYCWYSKEGNENLVREFAQNQRYKLYRGGEFYHLESDPGELQNLATGTLSGEQQQVRAILQSALDRYRDARPKGMQRRGQLPENQTPQSGDRKLGRQQAGRAARRRQR